MKYLLSTSILFLMSTWVFAETTDSALSCRDFNPTAETIERYPDLKGACEGIVERDGELYGKFTARVHRVSRNGRSVQLYLPATDHTFTVNPKTDAQILTGGGKIRPKELVKGVELHIYLSVSELATPDIEEIAFVTEDQLIIDHSVELGETVEKPGLVITSVIQTGAIVESIDYETREVALIGPEGTRFTVVAQEDITDLESVEPRDRVVIEYLESVAVFVAPEGSEPLMGDGIALSVAGEGELPGVSGVETYLVMARVEAIDKINRVAILRDENGLDRTINISEDVPLEMVEVGDQVRFRITRAMAISIEKPIT